MVMACLKKTSDKILIKAYMKLRRFCITRTATANYALVFRRALE